MRHSLNVEESLREILITASSLFNLEDAACTFHTLAFSGWSSSLTSSSLSFRSINDSNPLPSTREPRHCEWRGRFVILSEKVGVGKRGSITTVRLLFRS